MELITEGVHFQKANLPSAIIRPAQGFEVRQHAEECAPKNCPVSNLPVQERFADRRP
jgi:hypothetical protein